MEYDVFEIPKEEIKFSLKRGITKKDWKEHAISLQNLNKKTSKVEKLIELSEAMIPLTKNLQDSIPQNKAESSLWYILGQELRELNFILSELEEKKEISVRIIKQIKELTDWAILEETAIYNS